MRRLSRILPQRQKTLPYNPRIGNNIQIEGKLDSQLLTLPTEILIEILDKLPTQTLALCSLLCKELRQLILNHRVFGKRLTLVPVTFLRNESSEAFLHLLSRDIAEWLPCSRHQKLYRWRKRKSSHYLCHGCTSSISYPINPSLICNKGCKPTLWGIWEPERLLILRHELLGPEFGLPPSKFEHVCKNSRCKAPNELSLKVGNRNTLLVRRIHHHRIKLHSELVLKDSFLDMYDAVCWHSWSSITAIAQAAVRAIRKSLYQSNEDLRITPSSRYRTIFEKKVETIWRCPITFKCDQCATDLTVEVTSYPASHSSSTASDTTMLVEFHFEIYQDLGGLNPTQHTHAQSQVLLPLRAGDRRPLDEKQRLERLNTDLRQEFGCRVTWLPEEEEQQRISEMMILEQNGDSMLPHVGFLSQWKARDHPPGTEWTTEDLSISNFGPIFTADSVSPKQWMRIEDYAHIPFTVMSESCSGTTAQ